MEKQFFFKYGFISLDMYKLKNKKRNITTVWFDKTLFFILSGILFGSIGGVVLLLTVNYAYSYQPGSLEMTAVACAGFNRVFLFLLKKRICMIALFLCLSFLTTYRFALYLFGFGWGTFYGLAVSSWFLYDGLGGFMKIMPAFYPQYLFYFAGILCLGSIFPDEGIYSGIKNKSGKGNRIQYFLKIIVIIFLFVAGILFEINSKKYF